MSECNASDEHFDIEFGVKPTIEDQSGKLKRRVVPGSGDFIGWCLSTEHVGYRAHYVNKKTTPHLRTNCPGCAAGDKGEWHCYIWFLVEHTMELVPLDLPLGVAIPFEGALKRLGSMKGLKMKFWREPQCDTGQVRVKMHPAIDPEWAMRDTPSLTAWMAQLWRAELSKLAFRASRGNDAMTEAERARVENPAPLGAPKPKRRGRPISPTLVERVENDVAAKLNRARNEVLETLVKGIEVNGRVH